MPITRTKINRMDLSAILLADTAGWLVSTAPSFARAMDSHRSLLRRAGLRDEVVGAGALSESDRCLILDEINALTAKWSDECRAVLAEINAINAPVFFTWTKPEHEGGHRLFAKSSAFVGSLFEALAFRVSYWALPVSEQAAVVDALKQKGTSFLYEIAREVVDEVNTARLMLPFEMERTYALFQEMARDKPMPQGKQLSAPARQLVETPKAEIWLYLVPRQVSSKSTTAELLAASRALFDLASLAMQDHVHDARFSELSRHRSELLFQELASYGAAFRILATWTRALTERKETPRCEMCYRHLGTGMKRYCALHTRTSEKRPTAREEHVGRIYQDEIRNSLSTKEVREFLAGRRSAGAKISPQHLAAASAMLAPSEDSPASPLVRPAAALASLLYELRQYSSPGLNALLQSHFISMLAAARALFMSTPIDLESVTKLNAKRANALMMFTWRTFFVTFFAREVFHSEQVVGSPFDQFLGLDWDHPVSRDSSLTPSSIALDLLHMGTWMSADKDFDRVAYVDKKTIQRLRETAPNGSKPLSLRKIAEQLGVSHETVRKVLKGMQEDQDRSGPRTQSRKRIIRKPYPDLDLVGG